MRSKPRSQPAPGDYVGQKLMINIKLVGLEEVEGLSAVELMLASMNEERRRELLNIICSIKDGLERSVLLPYLRELKTGSKEQEDGHA